MSHATEELLHVAFPRARNTQQNTLPHATGHATDVQQTSLKALADRVLARNSARNNHATEGIKGTQQAMQQPPLFVASDPATATRPFNEQDMEAIKSGGVVMVWSDLLKEWLLWVKGERERKALKAQGCRLPVYTLGELALVVSWPVEDIRKAHRMKRDFNATIRPLADERRP